MPRSEARLSGNSDEGEVIAKLNDAFGTILERSSQDDGHTEQAGRALSYAHCARSRNSGRRDATINA